MRRLGKLHLDRMHARLRPAIVARRPPALEAAVEVATKAFGRRNDVHCGLFDPRIAGHTSVSTDVEIRKPAFEQKGICDRIEWQS